MAKFHIASYYRFEDMNYFLHFWSSPAYRVRSTEYRLTESDAYEPTVQLAQVGSKIVLAPVGLRAECSPWAGMGPKVLNNWFGKYGL